MDMALIPIDVTNGPSIDVTVKHLVFECDIRQFIGNLVFSWTDTQLTITFNDPRVLDFDITIVVPFGRFSVTAVPLLGAVIKKIIIVLLPKCVKIPISL